MLGGGHDVASTRRAPIPLSFRFFQVVHPSHQEAAGAAAAWLGTAVRGRVEAQHMTRWGRAVHAANIRCITLHEAFHLDCGRALTDCLSPLVCDNLRRVAPYPVAVL